MVRKQNGRKQLGGQGHGGGPKAMKRSAGHNSGSAMMQQQCWQHAAYDTMASFGLQLPSAPLAGPARYPPSQPMCTGAYGACGMATPPVRNCFLGPTGAPCDLKTALQFMGLLPSLPQQLYKQRQGGAQSQRLSHFNSFLDESYALQQRGHELWVKEQIELQRGADLEIISPANPPAAQPSQTAGTPVKDATGPSLVNGEEPQPARFATDVLMSPQMLAAALGTHAGVLSPPVTGAAAVQQVLLSPTACGLHPLLLQEITHSMRRRAMLSPTGGMGAHAFLVDGQVQEDAPISIDLDEDADLLPSRTLIFPEFSHHNHHHSSLPVKVESEVYTTGLAAHGSKVHRSQHGGTPSRAQQLHASGQLLISTLEHIGSPMSPAALLTYPAAASLPQGSCMDVGLLAAYPPLHSGHLDTDIHAELRIEAGLKRKR